jgi:hypothetical protein
MHIPPQPPLIRRAHHAFATSAVYVSTGAACAVSGVASSAPPSATLLPRVIRAASAVCAASASSRAASAAAYPRCLRCIRCPPARPFLLSVIAKRHVDRHAERKKRHAGVMRMSQRVKTAGIQESLCSWPPLPRSSISRVSMNCLKTVSFSSSISVASSASTSPSASSFSKTRPACSKTDSST